MSSVWPSSSSSICPQRTKPRASHIRRMAALDWSGAVKSRSVWASRLQSAHQGGGNAVSTAVGMDSDYPQESVAVEEPVAQREPLCLVDVPGDPACPVVDGLSQCVRS